MIDRYLHLLRNRAVLGFFNLPCNLFIVYIYRGAAVKAVGGEAIINSFII